MNSITALNKITSSFMFFRFIYIKLFFFKISNEQNAIYVDDVHINGKLDLSQIYRRIDLVLCSLTL